MFIEADHPLLQYCGRIDFSDKKAPLWIYAATQVRIRFTGTFIKAVITNHRHFCINQMGFFLDGGELTSFRLREDDEKETYLIAEGLEEKEHELLLFKRMDGNHSITFHGFEVADDCKLTEVSPLPERKIEFYGDSVSSGEICEAVDYVGSLDPENHDGIYTNSYYSFTWQTARRLGAQIHDIAQGGIAFLDGIGFFHGPDNLGMESSYNKLQYDSAVSTVKPWDFSKWIPQVVVVGLGQNDSFPVDFMKENYDGEMATSWRAHYKAFLRSLRGVYPEAYIICLTTIMKHDLAWDDAIGEVVAAVREELQDERISQYRFRRVGAGTPGHPRIPEHVEMTEELTAYINSLGIDW